MLSWKELRLLQWRDFSVKCLDRKKLSLLEWKGLKLLSKTRAGCGSEKHAALLSCEFVCTLTRGYD